MTTEDAFLADVLRSPADDSLRSIFADWLEDHGQPERAEFIRVQLDLARMDADDPLYDALVRREAHLLARHGRRWEGSLRASGSPRVEFRRGLPEKLLFGGRPTHDQLRLALRAAPIDGLSLWQADAHDVGALARMPEAARLRSLTLRSRPRHRIGWTGALLLAASPHLFGLDALAICGERIGVEGVRALSNGKLASLTELTIHCGGLRDDSVVALVESPLLPRLRALGLGWNDVTLEGARVLLTSPSCAGLEQLDLDLNDFRGPSIARLIAEASHLRRLKELNLRQSHLGAEGAAALAAAPHLASLERLNLQSCALGDEGARSLAASPHLARVRESWMCHNEITAAGVAALGRAMFWPGLRRLTLNDRSLDDTAIEALPGSASLTELLLWFAPVGPAAMAALSKKEMPKLKALDLVGLSSLGDDGAARLLAGPGLPALRSLRLTESGLTAEGAARLAAAPRLAGLTELVLDRQPLGPAGARSLASAPIDGLRKLSLADCGIGDEGAEALADAGRLELLDELNLYGNGISEGSGARLRRRFGERVTF